MAEMKLNEHEIAEVLARLPQWTMAAGKLHRDYRFPSFVLAMAFMNASAFAIEAMNHHPEWSNVYASVSVDLVTHDAGGITVKDVELAARLDDLARRFQA